MDDNNNNTNRSDDNDDDDNNIKRLTITIRTFIRALIKKTTTIT